MKLKDFEDLGGHMNHVRKLEKIPENRETKILNWNEKNPWPFP